MTLKFLQYYIQCSNKINQTIGTLTSWLTSLLVVVVCFDVVMRYLFKRSLVGVQELEWHIFSILFIVAAAYTLKHDKHVRVDIIYAGLSERGKAWINLLGTILFLLPFSILIIWTSKDFVLNSFTIRETSPDPGGLPARYLLKAIIPFGFLLIVIQGIALACESILTIAGRSDQTATDSETED